MRYKLTIAYDGSGFHGWQEQTTPPPDRQPLRTVQGVVRHALQHVARQPITLRGASRTDTGVHALGQCAAFDAELTIPLDRLALAVNSRLPDDVEVRHAAIVPDAFDVIADVVDKQYRYRLWNHAHRPLWRRTVVHHCWRPLDRDRMADAAARLIGAHDFAAFTNAGHGRASTVRTIHDCRVTTDPADPREIHILVSGNGFLYNMVRILAGTLVEIGRGRWTPDRIDHLLAAPDRRQSGPTLPPQGLCLEWIRYREATERRSDEATEGRPRHEGT